MQTSTDRRTLSRALLLATFGEVLADLAVEDLDALRRAVAAARSSVSGDPALDRLATALDTAAANRTVH